MWVVGAGGEEGHKRDCHATCVMLSDPGGKIQVPGAGLSGGASGGLLLWVPRRCSNCMIDEDMMFVIMPV